jgi:hypothetical protein
LVTEVAAALPIDWAPGVMSVEAALSVSLIGLLAYTVSGPYLGHPALRLLTAVPAVAVPAGASWVDNDVATLQFPLVYALFWALLWVPSTRAGRVVAVVVTTLASFTTPLAVTLVPLALLRLVVRRDRLGWAVTAALGAGVALQFGGGMLGYASRDGIGVPRYNPIWALYQYLHHAVPSAVFGQRWTYDQVDSHASFCASFTVVHRTEHRALVAGATVLLGALVYCGLRYGRPAWALAIVAIATSYLVYALSIMSLGCVTNRYFIAPTMLLYAAAAAVLRPRPSPPADAARSGPLGRPAVAFLTLFAIVLVVNLRTDGPRTTTSTRWNQDMVRARHDCAWGRPSVTVDTGGGWWMIIPCDRLRD